MWIVRVGLLSAEEKTGKINLRQEHKLVYLRNSEDEAKGAEIKQTRGTRVEEEVMIRVKGTYVGPYRQSFSLFFSIQEKDYLGQTRNLISAFKRYY